MLLRDGQPYIDLSDDEGDDDEDELLLIIRNFTGAEICCSISCCVTDTDTEEEEEEVFVFAVITSVSCCNKFFHCSFVPDK